MTSKNWLVVRLRFFLPLYLNNLTITRNAAVTLIVAFVYDLQLQISIDYVPTLNLGES